MTASEPHDAVFEQRRVPSTGGVTLLADVAGPAEAPVVVLMHGGGQTRHSWSGAMRALVRQGYRVINFDARGHGDSSWSASGAYDLDDRADDLLALLAGECGPLALVGASLGGATAIHAVARGLRPCALVLVDIVPHPEPSGIDRIVRFMHRHTDGFGTLDEALEAVVAYNPTRPRPSDPSGLLRNLKAGSDGRLYWHWDPLILAEQPSAHHGKLQRSAERLVGVEALSVLLVRGLQSDVVSDEGVAKFRELLPDLEVVDVAGAGHMVSGDRNDAFNSGVIGFLERRMPLGGR